MNSRLVLQSGVTLVEVLVAITIIAIMLVVVGFSVTSYIDARSQLLNNMKSVYLVEEGYEIIRTIRDEDWNTINDLTVGDTYFLDVSTTTLAVVGTTEVIDSSFYRSFIVEDLYRDADDDIAVSTTPGATVDPDSRMIIISVFGPTGTTSLEAVITNLHAI